MYCFNDVREGTSLIQYFKKSDVLCGYCRSKMLLYQKWFRIGELSVYALYLYNETLESMLFQFKEGRDVALKEVFLYPYQKEIFDMFKGYTIVYMPSSEKKNKERNFFTLALLYENILLPKLSLLHKKNAYKQTMQKFDERINVKDVIILDKNAKLPNTPLLLVDDVCTSGATLKSAYDLLCKHPYPIKAFVIGVHSLFVENCDKF